MTHDNEDDDTYVNARAPKEPLCDRATSIDHSSPSWRRGRFAIRGRARPRYPRPRAVGPGPDCAKGDGPWARGSENNFPPHPRGEFVMAVHEICASCWNRRARISCSPPCGRTVRSLRRSTRWISTTLGWRWTERRCGRVQAVTEECRMRRSSRTRAPTAFPDSTLAMPSVPDLRQRPPAPLFGR